MSKLEMILKIVDWEHRYKLDRLQGATWAIERIRHLAKHSKAQVEDIFDFTFDVRPDKYKENL